MPTFIAIWNCTRSRLWQKTKFDDRLSALASAVFTAEVEMRMKMSDINATWLFVAPEYAFSDADRGHAKPVEQATVDMERKLLLELARLTHDYRNLFLMPGTIAVREEHQARNTSHAWFGSREVWRFDKRVGVGEVTNEEAAKRTLIFRSGTGCAAADVSGVRYGAEICKDSTGGGTLSGTVQRHIVMGEGVSRGEGRDYIACKATELLIVAEPGSYGVFDYRERPVKTVAPYSNDETRDCKIYYYVA